MVFSIIIVYIMAVFMAWAAFDKAILNNKFGYGDKFVEGLGAMGPLCAGMVGFMCLAPVIGKVLTPIITPVFDIFGANPAMLAGSLLSMDMGGYPLALQMTNDSKIAVFSAACYGANMGACITFNIPVALGILEPEDRTYLSKGVMCGVIAIPVASFIGGLTMGLPVGTILQNLIPAIILAVLLTIGLVFIPEKMMNGFNVFSRFILIIAYVSLAAAIFNALTGIVIIPGMDPIGPQLEIVGIIGITLAGAYPFVYFVTTKFGKPLERLGEVLHVNGTTIGGIVATLANSIPMLTMVKDMDKRGKVVAMSFMVTTAFVFGDHLGYAAASMPNYVLPMIVTKLSGGVIAICIALLMTREEKAMVDAKDMFGVENSNIIN